MKAFSTLCALSLAALIAAPQAALAADGCTADDHAQHPKASQTDCGQHREHPRQPDPQAKPGETRQERIGDGKGQAAAKRDTAREQNAARRASGATPQQQADARGQAQQTGHDRPEE